jgi:hypothetical protein
LIFKKDNNDGLFYMRATRINGAKANDVHNVGSTQTSKDTSAPTGSDDDEGWTIVAKKGKSIKYKLHPNDKNTPKKGGTSVTKLSKKTETNSQNQDIAHKSRKQSNQQSEDKNNPNITENNTNNTKIILPKMNRMEAHEKWGHQSKALLDKSAKHHGIRLEGKLKTCAGCGMFKAKTKAISKSTNLKSSQPGERIFIDTQGPLPKSKGGHKYWMVAVDDYTDKTWGHFAASKRDMCNFVTTLIATFKGKNIQIQYIRCDNAGEHQTTLKEICKNNGIQLEYTAPGTPQQNGKAERRIALVWQRAMVMMTHAKLTKESQAKFWPEAVNTSCFLQDLMSTCNHSQPALQR